MSRTQLDVFSRVAGGTPEVQVAFNSNPTIGFSNITGGFFSSQQTPLREFRASEGSGIQIRLQASFGVYRQFSASSLSWKSVSAWRSCSHNAALKEETFPRHAGNKIWGKEQVREFIFRFSQLQKSTLVRRVEWKRQNSCFNRNFNATLRLDQRLFG